MAESHETGRAAEASAAELLAGNGWTILHRNWRWRHKEVDLIARRGDVVAFVEVRARRAELRGHPLATISWRKRRDLEAAARAWIVAHGRPGDCYRFDAVWVLTGDADPRPHHVEGAWTL